MRPRVALLRGSATAYHNQRTLLYCFFGLFSFIITPTASSSFPSAFSTARHGLGSIKGLVTAPTGSSYDLSDLSSPYNDFFVSDVDNADARRDNNEIDNINFIDSLITKITSASSPTSFTSTLAIATNFSAPETSVDSSSTPRERVFDNMNHPSDFCGITGRSRRNPTSSSTLLAASLTTVTSPWTSTSSSDSSATSRVRDFNPLYDTSDNFGIIGHDCSGLNEKQQLVLSSYFKLSYGCSSIFWSHKNVATKRSQKHRYVL